MNIQEHREQRKTTFYKRATRSLKRLIISGRGQGIEHVFVSLCMLLSLHIDILRVPTRELMFCSHAAYALSMWLMIQ